MFFNHLYVDQIVADVILLLFRMGESMLEPSVVLYIYHSVCLREYPGHSEGVCVDLGRYPEKENHVQHIAAQYILWYRVLWNLPAIILALFCGSWSDYVGRKMPVILPCFGTVLAVLLYLISTLNPRLYFPMALCGAALRGAFGGTAIIFMALQSHVTDIISEDRRTWRLGVLYSMNFFGNVAGFILMGIILSVSGFQSIFCTVMFMHSSCIMIALLFLRDHPTVEVNDEKSRRRAQYFCHVGHARESLDVLMRPREGKGRCHLWLLLTVVVVNQTMKSGEDDVTVLYVDRRPFNWNQAMFGYLCAVDFACMGFCACVLLPLFNVHFRRSDLFLSIFGVGCKIGRLTLMATSTSTWMVFLAVIVGSPVAMAISAIKSLLSKTVRKDEVGKIFALMSCGETIASMTGSLCFNLIYTSTADFFPGFTFLLNAGLYVCFLIVFVILARDMEGFATYETLDEEVGASSDTKQNSNKSSLAPEKDQTKVPPPRPPPPPNGYLRRQKTIPEVTESDAILNHFSFSSGSTDCEQRRINTTKDSHIQLRDISESYGSTKEDRWYE